MKILKLILLLIATYFIQCCATSGEAAGLGAGTGALFGAGVGAMASPGSSRDGRIKNIAIGAGSGAIIGSGLGYGAQKVIETREKEAFDSGKADGKRMIQDYAPSGQEPNLLPAKVEAIYVDDQVRGNVFVPAHVEYRIAQPARWQK